MKKYCFVLSIFSLCFFILGMNQAPNILQMEKFSISTPVGWNVEKKDENNVVLVMPEAKDEEISISISASTTSSALSLDETWNKMKSPMVKKKKVIYDGEQIFSKAKWKKLEMQEVVCQKDMRKVVLFTMQNGAKYLIQFGCPEDKYESMLPILNSIEQSFTFK